MSPKVTWPAHSSRRKLISGLCFLRMARCSRLRPHLSLTFAYRLQLSSFFRSSRDPSSTAWNTLFTYAWAGRKGHVIYFFFGRKKLSSLKNNARVHSLSQPICEMLKVKKNGNSWHPTLFPKSCSIIGYSGKILNFYAQNIKYIWKIGKPDS